MTLEDQLEEVGSNGSEHMVMSSSKASAQEKGDMSGRTVLAVDDEPQMLQLLATVFGQAGARIIAAEDGEEALLRLRRNRPDLVLLDVMMPNDNGVELCRKMRAESNVAIIMVSVVNQPTELVRALDAGADDYVTKPFSTQVLLARARAVLRRVPKSRGSGAAFDDGRLEVFLDEQRVLVNDQPIRLSNTEFNLLSYLIENAGQTCTFGQILTSVWGEEYRFNAEYVHVYVWRLRQKLERDPSHPRYLLTEHSLGYRFAEPVH
ncbi:MAG: response regulator transcription factor [Candidatus Promineifilaceae bacterium]|nr:response regulator transcription factor [Candidatus Promineifilaceae bacterium]